MEILWAVVLGTLFGFVLQRIGAADPDKIIGMLRLTDLHLMKTILLAIGLGSLLLFVALAAGWVDSSHLSVKSLTVGVPVGGALLGIGWAVAGFCPGTALVGVGAGRKDALVFSLGGLLGAWLFTLQYEALSATVLFDKLFGGAVTLASIPRYDSLVSAIDGLWVGLALAALLIAIAIGLPAYFRANQLRQ